MGLMTKIKDRKQLLGEIIRDLEDLKKRGFENQYAIDENIKFFEAIKSLPKYIKWLIKEMPKIDDLSLPRVTLGHRVTLGFAIKRRSRFHFSCRLEATLQWL